MSKVFLCYFSATGNTRRAISIAAGMYRDRGFEPREVFISRLTPHPVLEPDDHLIIAFPILGFSAPSVVWDWVGRFPRGQSGRAALLCVCGAISSTGPARHGWSGSAARGMAKRLGRRGYRVDHTGEVSYPENWTQFFSSPPSDDIAGILEEGDGCVRDFVAAVLDGRPGLVPRDPFRTLSAPVAVLFRLFARRFMGRLFVADSSCTSCGLCASTCPAGAIAMRRGKPEWRFTCTGCNRCINACPAAAIQTSTARLVLHLGINIGAMVLSWQFVAGLLNRLGLAHGAAGNLLFAAGFISLVLALTFLQLGPFDVLIRILERIPVLSPLFRTGFSTKFRRYLAPGFRPAPPDSGK